MSRDKLNVDSIEEEKQEPDEQYEVEEIISDQIINGSLHYYIKWIGYSLDESTWEPEVNIRHLTDIVLKYNEKKRKAK